jgi:transcription antitermination factor NusA-like protein
MLAATGTGAAAVITAVGACIGAAGAAVAAVIVALNRRTATVTETKVDQVHTLTNNALTEATDRRDVSEAENAQLRQAATDAERAS